MWRSIFDKVAFGPSMPLTSAEISVRLQKAAANDLAVFRRTPKWPGTSVLLTLTLKVKHLEEALSTRTLANAVTTLDDLILGSRLIKLDPQPDRCQFDHRQEIA